jgi:acetyl-CoA C-acetyltransferase
LNLQSHQGVVIVIYIRGIARTKFGKLRHSLPEIIYESLYNTVKDASISVRDVDAIFISNFLSGPLNSQLHLNALVASLLPGLNLPIVRIEAACASASAALKQAMYALESLNVVMVIGAEKMTQSIVAKQIDAIAMASDQLLDQSNGLIFPASYALIAQQYMREYQADHKILEEISFINHKNANLNPLAHFYDKQVTRAMIKASPCIASPLNLYDCSPISDGAAAVVLSKDKKSERDVNILASHFVTDTISITQRDNLTSFKATKLAADKARKEAEVGVNDIDIVEVHDCFTIGELLALEDLGFCNRGEAPALIEDGYVLPKGELPVNIDGGLIGNGHPIGATGLAQIYEIVTQIRGEAGTRQIDNVRVGMAQNIGGVGGTAAVTILGDD